MEKPGWGSGGNCSNCAMAWGERATNLDPAYTDVNRGMDPGLMARFCPHSVAKQHTEILGEKKPQSFDWGKILLGVSYASYDFQAAQNAAFDAKYLASIAVASPRL